MTGPRQLRRVMAVLATLAITTTAGYAWGAPPSPVPHDQRVSTFGVAPADATKVDGRPAFFYAASPGARLTDHVAVVNSGVQPILLTVYPSGAIPSATGSFTLAAVKDSTKAEGGWVQLRGGPTTLTIPARTKAGPTVRVLALSLHVPADATPGDHAAAVVASLQSTAVSKSGQRFKLLQRVAARVFIRVSGPLHPDLAVESLRPSYEGTLNPFATGRTVLHFVVHNRGNVKLGGKVTLRVRGLLGSTETVTLPHLPLLLPGSSVPETQTVYGVYPELLVRARVTVDGIAVPGDVDPGRPPTQASAWVLAVPWTLLLTVLVLVLAAVLYRRRVALPVPVDSDPSTAPGRGKHAAPSRSRRRLAS